MSNSILPGTAWADETAADVDSVELIELIKLQKEQIDDYKALDQSRQEQIDQLNASLNECRSDVNKEIDATARKLRWDSAGAITGYLVGLAGIVFGATVYAVKR